MKTATSKPFKCAIEFWSSGQQQAIDTSGKSTMSIHQKYKERDSSGEERFALGASSASCPKDETFVSTTVSSLVLIVLSNRPEYRTKSEFKIHDRVRNKYNVTSFQEVDIDFPCHRQSVSFDRLKETKLRNICKLMKAACSNPKKGAGALQWAFFSR